MDINRKLHFFFTWVIYNISVITLYSILLSIILINSEK